MRKHVIVRGCVCVSVCVVCVGMFEIRVGWRVGGLAEHVRGRAGSSCHPTLVSCLCVDCWELIFLPFKLAVRACVGCLYINVTMNEMSSI